MNRLSVIRAVCSVFPPIISQSIREKLISIEEAENIAFSFNRKSFTGSYLGGNTKDFHAFKFYIHGYFDWRNIILTRKILQIRKGAVVEIGANIGTETISLADVAKPYKVYAFEPVPSNYNSILQAKEYNKLTNLFLFNLLVSNKSGKTQFKVPTQNNSGSGYISAHSDETTKEFEVVTLDETFTKTDVISVIVADVEGFEYNVIMGAAGIINKDRPYLIIEVNPKYLESRANVTVSYFYNELIKMGYQCFYICKIGLKEVNIKDFQIKNNKNWICIPDEDLHYKNVLSNAILMNAFNPIMNQKIL